MPAMAQNVGARSTCPTGSSMTAGASAALGRRPPDERHAHQRLDVIRTLEDQSGVAAEIAVVGRIEDIRVLVLAALGEHGEHAAERVVDELVLDLDRAVDLAVLVVRQARRHEARRPALRIAEAPLVEVEPMPRPLREDRANAFGRAGMPARQRTVAEVAALSHLVPRRIERMVRIRKAHPAEERRVRIERAQPGDRAVGDPVRVVMRARDGVVRDLGRTGVAAAGAGQHGAETGDVLGMMLVQPCRVVVAADRAVRRELDVVEAAPAASRRARRRAGSRGSAAGDRGADRNAPCRARRCGTRRRGAAAPHWARRRRAGCRSTTTPCVSGCCPVSIVARDGMQTTFCTCARR